MTICKRCRNEARAFIKAVHLKAAQRKEVAIKLGKAAVAACILCSATIGPPASPSSAATQPSARAGASYSVMWEFQPVHDFMVQSAGQAGRNPMQPMILPVGRGDSEPPHFDGPEQTRDGSAPTYSGTAATFGIGGFLPDASSGAGAATTVLPIGLVQRELMPVTPDPQAIFSSLGLPEHAALDFQLPVMEPVRIPKSLHASTGPRSDRNRDRRAS